MISTGPWASARPERPKREHATTARVDKNILTELLCFVLRYMFRLLNYR
jgi:hypothetical protein